MAAQTLKIHSNQSSVNNFIADVRECASRKQDIRVVCVCKPHMSWLEAAQEHAVRAKVDISFETKDGEPFHLLQKDKTWCLGRFM